jgi:M6 family metalloprotease-like protein
MEGDRSITKIALVVGVVGSLAISGCSAPEPSIKADEPSISEPPNNPPAPVEEPYEPSFDLAQENIEDDQCKLEQKSYAFGPDLAAHFPPKPAVLPLEGRTNVDFFLIDWQDVPGTSEDRAFHTRELNMFKDFVHMVSEGKLDFAIEIHDWTRVPGFSTDYIIESQDSGGNAKDAESVLQPMLDDWISAIDPNFDFSNTDLAMFGIPTSSDSLKTGAYGFGQSKTRGFGARVITEEKIIHDWMAAGSWFIDNPPQPPWIFYGHEWGHMVGLADYRDMEKQFVPDDEYEKYLANPMGSYEVMDNQGGPFRTFSSWVRWISGWLEDDQVTCVLAADIDDELYELRFLNEIGAEPKSLVIKLSEEQAIVVESRRWDEKFDVPIVNNGDGLVVYTVDTTKGHLEGGLRLVSPRDISKYLNEPNTFPDFRMLDAIFEPGDKVEIEGVQIEMVNLGSDRDVVRLSK